MSRLIHRAYQAWRAWFWIVFRRRWYPKALVRVRGAVPPPPIRVDLRDEVIGTRLYLYGDYEPELRELIRQMPLRGAVAVDVGAHVGLHTTVMQSQAGGAGTVLAFEPESRNFALLRENTGRARGATAKLIRKAVSAKAGHARLELNPRNFGDHRVTPTAPGTPRPDLVEMTTLDEELRDFPENSVRLIKMDIQGHEFHALQGMGETLRRHPRAYWLVEAAPDALRRAGTSPTHFFETLRALGFHGWEIHSTRVLPWGPPEAYELIREGKEVNLLLSKDEAALCDLLNRTYGYHLELR